MCYYKYNYLYFLMLQPHTIILCELIWEMYKQIFKMQQSAETQTRLHVTQESGEGASSLPQTYTFLFPTRARAKVQLTYITLYLFVHACARV